MRTEGMGLGGFVPCERMHAGSRASLRRVERPGETVPRVMKRPRGREGDDPAAIVGFEGFRSIGKCRLGPRRHACVPSPTRFEFLSSASVCVMADAIFRPACPSLEWAQTSRTWTPPVLPSARFVGDGLR